MEFKFLPSVALVTVITLGASSFFIAVDGSVGPVRTLDRVILVGCGISSVVLSIVGVDALASIVVVDVGTEDGFVLVEVKFSVLFKIVEELDENFVGTVGEGAVVSVLALIYLVGVEGTKLSFVTVWMVELFYFIVAESAVISIWALLALFDLLADLRAVVIDAGLSSSVLFMMVIVTEFRIMVSLALAGLGLEVIKVKNLGLISFFLFPTQLSNFLGLEAFQRELS